jgi:E3 ubiquitin-protein ligase RFWD2
MISSCYHLAFGSADHCVHYYDLRNTKSALNVFRGHKKAVSYVKFLNSESLVSASTDSQLKLWNVNQESILQNSFSAGNVSDKFSSSSFGQFYINKTTAMNTIIMDTCLGIL